MLAPVVSVMAPAAELVTVPAPASAPMLWENPARSSVAPPATVTFDDEPKTLAAPAFSVPLLTVVVPV